MISVLSRQQLGLSSFCLIESLLIFILKWTSMGRLSGACNSLLYGLSAASKVSTMAFFICAPCHIRLILFDLLPCMTFGLRSFGVLCCPLPWLHSFLCRPLPFASSQPYYPKLSLSLPQGHFCVPSATDLNLAFSSFEAGGLISMLIMLNRMSMTQLYRAIVSVENVSDIGGIWSVA